jgi:hypothetical protein
MGWPAVVRERPDFPIGIEWDASLQEEQPRSVEFPLAFLCQIALEDVARFTDELPKEGLLSFFTLDQQRLFREMGYVKEEATARDRLRVIFTPPRIPLKRLSPPAALPPSHVAEPSHPIFRSEETWPQVEGTIIGDPGEEVSPSGIAMSVEAWQQWADIAPENPPAQMLGHPCGLEFPIGRGPDTRLLLALEATTCKLPWDLFGGRNGHLFIGIHGRALAQASWSEAFLREW